MKQEIRQRLVHRVVEHVRQTGVFFEAHEVEEDFEGVLGRYGWQLGGLEREAREAIVQELEELAERADMVESARMTFNPRGCEPIRFAERASC